MLYVNMRCSAICYLNLMTFKLNFTSKVFWGARCAFNGTTNAIRVPITPGPRTRSPSFFAHSARKIQKLDPLEANLRKPPPAAPSSRRAKPQCQSACGGPRRAPLLFCYSGRIRIEAMRLKMRRLNPSTAAGPQLLHLTWPEHNKQTESTSL